MKDAMNCAATENRACCRLATSRAQSFSLRREVRSLFGVLAQVCTIRCDLPASAKTAFGISEGVDPDSGESVTCANTRFPSCPPPPPRRILCHRQNRVGALSSAAKHRSHILLHDGRNQQFFAFFQHFSISDFQHFPKVRQFVWQKNIFPVKTNLRDRAEGGLVIQRTPLVSTLSPLSCRGSRT